MNRRLITRLLIIFVTSWSLLGAPLSAYAHDDEATIELNVTQAQPGMSIAIRGSGFEPGDAATIRLMLVSSDRPQVLGTATADDHGDLAQVVWLPADLTDGAYEVRVADTHHVATAVLSIVTDSSGDEEGSQRGEEEPLLAPMPARSASTAPANSIGSATPIASVPSTDTTPAVPPALLFSSALALVILIVGLVVISRRSQ